MINYYVMLRRFPGSSRPDACIWQSDDREEALREMKKYYQSNGFTITDIDGRFTIANITLVEKEPIYGAPTISETPLCDIDGIMVSKKGTGSRK